MFEKGSKYYADWRDSSGTRKRKAFTSKRAALQFEAEQKELAHPKLKARVKLWPRCSVPGTSRCLADTKSSTSPRPSSPSLAICPRPNSPARTSLKSTSKSSMEALPMRPVNTSRHVSVKSSAGSGKPTVRPNSTTKHPGTQDCDRATSRCTPTKFKRS